MDSDVRREMENNMKNILDNQYDLKYLKKQTSVVESTLNILRRTTGEVNNFEVLSELFHGNEGYTDYN